MSENSDKNGCMNVGKLSDISDPQVHSENKQDQEIKSKSWQIYKKTDKVYLLNKYISPLSSLLKLI